MARTAVLFTALTLISACRAAPDAPNPPGETGSSALSVDVFTSPEQAGAVNSTIVLGQKEALVIDAQYTKSGANAVADRIEASGRTLTQIFITHPHPDHYFGATTLLERFPDASVVATAETVEVMKASAAAKADVATGQLGPEFPGAPVIPTPLDGNALELEGHTLPLLPGLQGDTHGVTGVKIPDANTVVLGDVLFSGVHAWTADSNAESRAAWARQLDALEDLDGVTRFIPGHQTPDADQTAEALRSTKAYLATFDSAVTDNEGSDAIIAAMSSAYPDLAGGFFLQLGAKVAAGEMEWQ